MFPKTSEVLQNILVVLVDKPVFYKDVWNTEIYNTIVLFDDISVLKPHTEICFGETKLYLCEYIIPECFVFCHLVNYTLILPSIKIYFCEQVVHKWWIMIFQHFL